MMENSGCSRIRPWITTPLTKVPKHLLESNTGDAGSKEPSRARGHSIVTWTHHYVGYHYRFLV